MFLAKSRYLIRLDDACETKNREKWNAIECILDKHHIKPIVAVIPQNEDTSLHLAERDTQFWEQVRQWQGKGWVIAMHGYRHLYHSVDKKRLIFPFYSRSEFAGLDLETQSDLLTSAYARFVENGVRPTVWVAPGHCFDRVTLEALQHTTDIRIISDGIAFFPYVEHGFTFVPQQLWWPKKKRTGIWTICLHPNTMSEKDIEAFDQALLQLGISKKCITLQDALTYVRRKELCSRVFARLFWLRWSVRGH